MGVKPPSPASVTTKVSTVIVVWNAMKYVVECLESFDHCCRDSCSEVIVVDNASSDGTPELVAERFPWVKLVRNEENLGFAKANNIGIALASGEYLCLVNSDVKFVQDCFTPMAAYMDAHPDVAMLGPRMLDAEGKVGRSTMRFPTLWNSFCRALGLDSVFKRSRMFAGQLMSDFSHSETVDAEVLNGWFWMVRRSALAQVGVLDERFFMYGEDIDWCYRFHRAGHRIVFFAGAEAIHYGGASSASAPVRFYVEMQRANRQYWRKHHGRLAQFAYLFLLGLQHSIRIAGYSLGFLLWPSRRGESLAKIRRSRACLAGSSNVGK
jgi:GT2 family glycosyltransferase